MARKRLFFVKNFLPDIEKIIAPFIEKMGIELVGVEVIGKGNTQMLKVIIWEKGGITIDRISKISRHIADILDEEEIVKEPFNLEVSSLGLDRPLNTIEDFRRAEGEDVELSLDDGSIVNGRIISTGGGVIVLEEDGVGKEVAINKIDIGKIKIDF
jgi:ribosome maturation factor RimP